MTKVSKTGFMNLIRCPRFAALHKIERDKLGAIVSFSDDEEDLFSAENEARKLLYLESMQDDEEKQEVQMEELKVMQPYYDHIETLSAKAIQEKFSGELTFSNDTYKQKRFQTSGFNYQFYCFLDGYLEGDINAVFESKATTSSKFVNILHKGESIFKKNIDGILMLKRELGYDEEGLASKEERFYDKYSDTGMYVYDLAYQRFVIENSKEYDDTKNYKYYLAVLNHEYVFDGTYDENNQPIYQTDIITFIDFTEVTKRMMPMIKADINTVERYLDISNVSPVDLGKHCQRNKTRQCVFYNICFGDLPKENSIFTYTGNHHGFKDERDYKHLVYDLINEDKMYHLLDVPKAWLKRDNNLIQREAVETNTPYINKGKIKAGIDQLKYPIYHLDFESFPCPLPRFKDEKPYQQSLFQFSIHIEHEHQAVDEIKDNISYLAPDLKDHREDLIIALLEAIKPDGGSVLVYNQTFEKGRIKELAEMFPKYKDRLHDISNRLFDLMDIVKTKTKFYQALGYDEADAKRWNYYASDLNGSYSIKKVLPSLSDLSYQDLPVKDGTNAYLTYAKYNPLDEASHQEAMAGLIMYCRRDTYSMYVVLEALRELINK